MSNEGTIQRSIRFELTVKRVARSTAWPLPETQWTRFFLDAANKTLGPDQPHNMASATYPALSEGVTFSTAPWEQDVEIVGPVKGKALRFVEHAGNGHLRNRLRL